VAARLRTPRSVAYTNKVGSLGRSHSRLCVVRQEPILVALRWLGVDMRRIWFPLAVSNVLFAVLYYAIVWFGLDQVANLWSFSG